MKIIFFFWIFFLILYSPNDKRPKSTSGIRLLKIAIKSKTAMINIQIHFCVVKLIFGPHCSITLYSIMPFKHFLIRASLMSLF